MHIDTAGLTRIGYAQGTQLLQPTGNGVRAGYSCIGCCTQVLVQNRGNILYMVTPTEINTEQSKHDIAVLVAVVRTADIKATV